MRLQTA